ncbi:MAG: hypothetical protein WA767_11850, partial [Pseudolabrys sp.]
MTKHATILGTALLSLVLIAGADAAPKRAPQQQQGRTIECNERGCSDHASHARAATAASGAVQSRVVTDANGS